MASSRPIVLVVLAGVSVLAEAQQRPPLTTADYARAERTLGATVNALVSGTAGRATWLAGGRAWYRVTTPDGAEFVMVDPAQKTRARAFDHARVAAALSRAADTTVSPTALSLTEIVESAGRLSLRLEVEGRRFTCDTEGNRCTRDPASDGSEGDRNRTSIVSPDGRRAAFVRGHNLWVRDLVAGSETRLTTDGVEHFGYATNNAGWIRSDTPVLLWSPDSRRIATFQHDGRAVGMMYLVSTTVGHPTLDAWKYPLPGDSAIFTIQRVIVDVERGTVTRLKMPPDAHRSTHCDHVVCRGADWADVEWYPDGSHLGFVSTSRDHKQAVLRIADAATGEVRDVLEEWVATQYESGYGGINWRVLPASNEVIWFSERDDWGHLYLYDLATGKLKQRITAGPGPVLDLVRVDEKTRTLYFTAAGREPGRDPYFRHFYRIGMDGKGLQLLTPDDADHDVSLSPDGQWLVDTWSTPVTPPTTVLRDARGRLVMPLERVDISRLVATGWTPPIPFTVKARDGKTDLYGLMYRPRAFDSTRTYPIVNYLYPGPQGGSVGSRSFLPARGDKQALAELGFIVVEVDALGSSGMRSKSFHDAYYGNMGDNGLPDQIAAIKQLAARHRWMDLDRVGIWGHSGGGFAAADGILRYPHFYKVAVSQAGNHDNRIYEDDWGERYHGLLVRNPDGTTNYDSQANQLLAKNLKGKLLIAHGSLDDNVPPNNTLALADALIKANKDFDFLLLPNRRHGFGNEPYMMRRRWDYFVRHLLSAEPPQDYEIGRKPATSTGPAVPQAGPAQAALKARYQKAEYQIPMRDGVKLFTVVYSPRDSTGSYPILMQRTPYSAGPYGPDAYRGSLGPGSPRYVEEGFIFVYQDVRGRHMSEGQFVDVPPQKGPALKPGDIDESTDTWDTVEWLLRNVQRNNGRVGIYGISYPGFYTAASCINAHPAIKACSPQAPMIDIADGDDNFHNGAFLLPHNFSFYTSFGRTPRTGPGPDPRYPFSMGTPDAYQFYLQLGPVGPGTRRIAPPETAPLWAEILKHPNYDAFWEARDLRRRLVNVKPAFLTVGGFYDTEDLAGPWHTYRAIAARSPATENRLVMGPWSHGGWSRGDGMALGSLRWSYRTGPFYRDSVELPFFVHHLKGGPDPQLPKVLIFRTGADRWDRYDVWPPAGAAKKSLYLHPGGVLSFEPPAAASGPAGYDEYVSDPAKPVPLVDRIEGHGMPRDYITADQRFASRRPDVLVYQTPVLSEDVTIAGPVAPRLHVSTSGTDADFIVKLIDVFPDSAPDWPGDSSGFKVGGYQQLVRGEPFRGRFRHSPSSPLAFVPNQPDSIRFDMPDVNHTFRRGHRIMVQIQSTWFPHIDRNPQTFVPNIFEARSEDFRKATMRLYRTPARPSRLDVVVLPE